MKRFSKVLALLFCALIFSIAGVQLLEERPSWEKEAKNALSWINDALAQKKTDHIDGGLQGVVAEVKDGDTIVLRINGSEEFTVRLYGIDAPEWDQPFGQSASERLEELVARSRVRVRVEDTDTYGRLVGTVYLEGENINLSMVQGGFAWWYEYYASSEQVLEQAEEYARAASLGLWQEPNPVAPWDWRHRH